MEVEHVTLLFEETAEDAAARLARGTANARANIEDVTRAVEAVRTAFIEDVKTAVQRCFVDIQESIDDGLWDIDGRVTYTGMRHEDVQEDDDDIAPASQIEMHFEVKLLPSHSALPFDYSPSNVIIIDREGVHGVRLMARGVSRSIGPSNVTSRVTRDGDATAAAAAVEATQQSHLPSGEALT